MGRRRDKQQAEMQAGARRIFLAAGVGLVLVVGVVGWSVFSSATTDENVVRRQSEAYLNACMKGRWSRMYALQSAATHKKVSQGIYAEWMDEIYRIGEGFSVLHPKIRSVTVTGETGSATFKYDHHDRKNDIHHDVEGALRWRREDDAWRMRPTDALRDRLDELAREE